MTTTPIYKQLEKEYAKFAKTRYGVSCSSGTAALHLALLALDIGPGDEVILPDFTMAACGFAVSYVGARPIFIDCKEDLTIDVSKIKAQITPRTKAIMAVDIYGRLCDYKGIRDIANKIPIIRDACESQGTYAKADITVYSFYKNKIVNSEEGGIVCMSNRRYKESTNFLKSMAFDRTHSYYHKSIGFNYRMPDSQALLALKSLKEYEKNAKKRRQIEAWYDQNIPEEIKMPKRDAVWVYDILHPHKEEVIKRVPGARHFFKPLSTMPMWSDAGSGRAKVFSELGMYLPVNPQMTKKEVLNICKIVKELL